MVGFQYALTKNDLIDVSYVGIMASNCLRPHRTTISCDSGPFARKPNCCSRSPTVLRQDLGSGCGLRVRRSPMGVVASLFGFCSVSDSAAAGQLFALQRSRDELHSPLELGLSLLASYTYSRSSTIPLIPLAVGPVAHSRQLQPGRRGNRVDAADTRTAW